MWRGCVLPARTPAAGGFSIFLTKRTSSLRGFSWGKGSQGEKTGIKRVVHTFHQPVAFSSPWRGLLPAIATCVPGSKRKWQAATRSYWSDCAVNSETWKSFAENSGGHISRQTVPVIFTTTDGPCFAFQIHKLDIIAPAPAAWPLLFSPDR